jgi:hypothetical protein
MLQIRLKDLTMVLTCLTEFVSNTVLVDACETVATFPLLDM